MMPKQYQAELAIIGRSNVGKSSLINALSNSRISRVSKTPGRTRLLNLFELNNHCSMVDLPGYGYVKSNQTMRLYLFDMIQNYIQHRVALQHLLILIDCRRQLTDLDMQLILWCQKAKIAISIVLTKVDKLKYSQLLKSQKDLENALTELHVAPHIFAVSSAKNTGISELNQYILGQIFKLK